MKEIFQVSGSYLFNRFMNNQRLHRANSCIKARKEKTE